MKSEPDEVSVDDVLAMPDATVPWFGVRNFQARNFMRDRMRVGDGVLFYHSGCAEPGIAGIAQVASPPYPDETQFDPDSDYYDPTATRAAPRWVNVDVRVLRKTPLLSLARMRAEPTLSGMLVLRRGNRLSITPVTPDEWRTVTEELLPRSAAEPKRPR